MLNLVKNYINNLNINDLEKFLKSNNIYLNDNELKYTYSFIKKNYEAIYYNPNLDLSKYKSYYTENNFNKILNLIEKYKKKYINYLN